MRNLDQNSVLLAPKPEFPKCLATTRFAVFRFEIADDLSASLFRKETKRPKVDGHESPLMEAAFKILYIDHR